MPISEYFNSILKYMVLDWDNKINCPRVLQSRTFPFHQPFKDGIS